MMADQCVPPFWCRKARRIKCAPVTRRDCGLRTCASDVTYVPRTTIGVMAVDAFTLSKPRAMCPRERCSATFNGVYQSDAIYKAMIREAKYPPDLFEGSPETLTALKAK